MATPSGVLTIERLFDATQSPPLYLYSLLNSSVSIVCAITSPSAGASLTQGTPVTISGTISVPGTVNVYLGATLLGAAVVGGLSWTFVWTPQSGDVGAGSLSAIATANTGGSGSAPSVAVTVAGYDWRADPQLMDRWKAGSLANLAPNPLSGALVATGGSVTTTAAVIDGQAAWQFTKGSAIRLMSASAQLTYGPYQIFVIARATGSPANTDVLLNCSTSSIAGSRIGWNTAAQYSITGTGFHALPCTPANWNLINWYHHATASRAGVNGAAYSAAYAGGANFLQGVSIGALFDGTLSGGWDIAEVFIVEGQASALFMAGMTAYVRSTYPSIGVAASPPATFSVDLQSLTGSGISGAFDIIVMTGQSNNACEALAATATAGANTFQFGKDGVLQALAQLYDNPTNILDPIASNVVTSIVGGNATSLANTYSASTGRPCVIVPCASLGAGYFPVPTSSTVGYWDSTYPRGNKLRNSLYGSALARIKNLLALGGTLRFIHDYQGETEALQAGTYLANWQANKLKMIHDFEDDLGFARDTLRVIIRPVANASGSATAPNIATIQAAAAALALSGKRLVPSPYAGAMNPDNLHVIAAGCDSIGANDANLALAQPNGTGWH